MKYDEFVASHPNPEPAARASEQAVETPAGEVVLAGAILSATRESCCIDINGAQYEIDPHDVIDIAVLSPTAGGKPEVVLVKANRDAVLRRHIPVHAALVAATGTWLNVVPVAAEAAEAAEAAKAA